MVVGGTTQSASVVRSQDGSSLSAAAKPIRRASPTPPCNAGASITVAPA